MEHSSAYCYFSVKGDFSPDELTTTLGIEPTKHWAVGDFRKNGTKYDFALWETGFTVNEYPNVVIECISAIQNLIGKEDRLNAFKKDHDVDFVLEIVPSIRNGEKPIVEFGMEVIKFCYLTETDIDIDMYIYPFDEF